MLFCGQLFVPETSRTLSADLQTQYQFAESNAAHDLRAFENVADADDRLIGAYYYPWYAANGRHWNEGVPRRPLLGEYDSADEGIINRHIDWATGHGIDFFAISWWGPQSFEANVLREQFLPADLAGEMSFAILYESTGRLDMQQGQFDLSSTRNVDRLADDFRHLAETYFHEPNYLRIDGRPVVFIYLTRIMQGEALHAFEAAREAVRVTTGLELFLIGDEVYWQEPSTERVELFDTVTAYNMHTSSPDVADWFLRELPGKYAAWADVCEEADVLFVPSVIPGFDDTAVRPEARHPVIPRSTQLFAAQLETALRLAEHGPRLVMINSWNEWHEDTAIEPAEDSGMSYLQVLRDALMTD